MATNYTPITKEQEELIKDLFSGYGCIIPDFTFSTTKEGYFVKAEQMYDYITFRSGISTLQGYLKIAEILGVDQGDEVGKEFYSGCETCDYGSNYEVSLRFWRS